MRYLKVSLFFLTIFLFVFFPKKILATNYYVAGDTGLDTNDGSISTPWKTIQKSAATMTAGDTVSIKGGLTYNEAYSSTFGVNLVNSGAPDSPIVYQAWEGTGSPTIISNATQVVFYNQNKDNITLDGLIVKVTVNNQSGIVLNSTNDGITLINNIIYTSPSISGSTGIQHGGLGHSIKLYNNTINGSFAYAIKLVTFGPAYPWTCDVGGDFIVNNNIITNATVGIRIASNAGLHLPDCYNSNYNLLFGNSSNYQISSQGANDIISNPLFVDYANSDFRLQKTSPAINNGVDLSGSGVTDDIVNVARPQGSGYDLGAYEYYDIPVSLTALAVDPTTDTTPTFTGTSSTISGATISSISYSIDGGSYTTSGVTGTDSFSITVPTLTDGSHTINVKATDSYGNSSDSSLLGTDSFTVDTRGPVASSITSNTTSNSATISYLNNESSSTYVEYGTTNTYGNTSSTITNLGSGQTASFSLSNLNECTQYHYRIISTDGLSNQTTGSDMTFRTLCPSGPDNSQTINCNAVKPEGTPTITSIKSLTSTKVKLIFTDPFTNNVTSYFVEYGPKEGEYIYSTASIGGKGTTEAEIGSLAENGTYYFRVRATNVCTVGDWSKPAVFLVRKTTIFQNLKTDITEKTTSAIDTAKNTLTEKVNGLFSPEPTQIPTSNQLNQNQTNIFQVILNFIKNVIQKIF